MFIKRIPLFRLFGFQVSIDLSWLILALLVTWSLAIGYYPTLYEGLGAATYWSMGVVSMIGLLFSIIVHELSHSLVARTYNMPITGITLFIFGGVAEMSDEPTGAVAEFNTAVIGPITSIVVAALFYGLYVAAAGAALPESVSGVLAYLALINLVLAVFNLVPAFPLDGGRMLRAALWKWNGNFRRATRIASGFGSAFGLVLIALAVFSVLAGNFIGGMWWFLIGLFVRGAAQASYQQTVIRQTLQDVPVAELMTRHPVTVERSLPLGRLVDEYFLVHHYKMFPVVEEARLHGCIALQDVKRVPREQWDMRTVGDAMAAANGDITVTPNADCFTTFAHMQRKGMSRLLVAEGDLLAGIISTSDIMRFLAVKLDLEEDEALAGHRASAAAGRVAHQSR